VQEVPSYRFLKLTSWEIAEDRAKGSAPFEVVCLVVAGPIGYKLKPKKEAKAYILLFALSLTRAVHLELLRNQTVEVHQASREKAAPGRFNRITAELLLPQQSG